jgi:hypothetical protein
MGIITIERFFIFLLLLLFLLIYKILMELIFQYTIKNKKMKEYIRKYDNEFNYIIKILLFIQK